LTSNQIENILEVRTPKRCDSTRLNRRSIAPSHPFNLKLLYFLSLRKDASILILFASLHAARAIQSFWRKRFQMREQMKALIVKKWKLFCTRKAYWVAVEDKV
jgi:hypothetical protein